MKKPNNNVKEFFTDMLDGLFRKRVLAQPKQADVDQDWTARTIASLPATPAPPPVNQVRLVEPERFKPTFIPPRGRRPQAKINGGQAGSPARKPFFQLSKTVPAFWTVASLLSFVVNMVLIVAVVLLGRELFTLKAIVGDKLLGGLYENFIYMDQAHIQTNITVSDTIPINFSLPISTNTVVVLTQDTTINGANVRINTGGMSIDSSANIILPAGTNLPVHLELNVPVTTTVPVKLNVPVDIPLAQTELHKPFIGLQQVIAPFYNLLQPQIKDAQSLSICIKYPDWCDSYFNK